jgi:hypothetical protein
VTDLSAPVFGHLRAGVQASLFKTAQLIDGLDPPGRTGAHRLRFTGCAGAKARRSLTQPGSMRPRLARAEAVFVMVDGNPTSLCSYAGLPISGGKQFHKRRNHP